MENTRYVITDLYGNFYTQCSDGWEVSKNRWQAIKFTYINAKAFYQGILSEYEKKVFKIVPSDDVDKMEIDKMLRVSEERVNQVENMRKDCDKMISDRDKKINDILHYIELNDLNSEEAYEACCMLHDIRLERRRCKDLHKMTDYLCGIDGGRDVLQKIAAARKNIRKMQKRIYTPRKLPELFTNTKNKGEK